MKVSICGAGTMGRGIAIVCAQSGCETVLYDVNPAALEKAVHAIHTSFDSSVAKQRMTAGDAEKAKEKIIAATTIDPMKGSDFIIEAIIEQLDAKTDFFKVVEAEIADGTTILASNTSSISINSIARELQRPEQFIGLHFFNPANIMKLVEIINGVRTSSETLQRSVAFAKQLGKTPAVAKDVPGFIVNRVARNYYNEAQRIVTESAASIQQVDVVMKSLGFKMGPFELMDLIGVDVNLDVTKSISAQYFNEPRFQPSVLQQQYVDAGLHGKKTGRGFYDYTEKTE